jgi:hypothetical protein
MTPRARNGSRQNEQVNGIQPGDNIGESARRDVTSTNPLRVVQTRCSE